MSAKYKLNAANINGCLLVVSILAQQVNPG